MPDLHKPVSYLNRKYPSAPQTERASPACCGERSPCLDHLSTCGPNHLWQVSRNLPAHWATIHQPPFLFSPGVATYTDKLFKFRNNRWEDILSDEVNVARGVASLFAGRSVACVDRTVSLGVHGGLGRRGGHTAT